MLRHKKNEDLDGYLRGAHQDGEDICAGFIFIKPGSRGDWGWNSIYSLECGNCGRPAKEHIVLREPPAIKTEKDKKEKLVQPSASIPGAHQISLGVTTEQKRMMTQEANAVYDDMHMLDDKLDPLAVAARPKPPPPPPPPEASPAEDLSASICVWSCDLA